jgi:hypothetical protein
MTRAKSKPIVPSRESPSARRPVPSRSTKPSAAPKAKPAGKAAAPAKSAAKVAPAATPVKGKSATAKPSAASAAAAKPVPAKPVPAKPTAAKAVPAKPTGAKTEPAKPALAKPIAAKPSAVKPLPAKAVAAAVRLDTPAKIRPIEQAVGVSSDAVARRTGKSWAQWFALLDAAGAAELDHKGIVAVLAQRHGVGPWWQQMVTVAYEQARGKNGNLAADDGFQVDVVKTLELPLAKLYRFWSEPAERNKWLADDRFSIHKATASKSIRARWGRGVSRIDVDFCEKGPSKSQVTVQHNRIETSDAAEQMKAYWAKKISALEALLTRA